MDHHFSLHVQSPVRPPDWRVRLAARLHADRLAFVSVLRKDVPDLLVRHLLTVHHGWPWNVPTPEDAAAIRAAVAWHQTASAADLQTVQLRLLARESDDQIGLRVGQPPAVVERYEQLFFNCRDRLDRPSFVTNQFLGGWDPAPPRPIALRRCAYRLGTQALDAVLAAVDDHHAGRTTTRPDTLAGYDAAIGKAWARLWLAAETIPPDALHGCPDITLLLSAVRRPLGRLAASPLVLPLYSKPIPDKDLQPDLEADDVDETRVRPRTPSTAAKIAGVDLPGRPARAYTRRAAQATIAK